jgi:hypothetical protein
LVALEAWSEGTPVLAHASCEVLAGQLGRSGGGRSVNDYEEFEGALDDLWLSPEVWREYGLKGRQYVGANYGSREAFTRGLVAAIEGLKVPLRERLRRQGVERAQEHDRPAWRRQFGRVVEELLHAPARPVRVDVEIRPRTEEHTVSLGQDSVLLPVRVTNHGTHPLVHEGPGRTVLCCLVCGEAGDVVQDTAAASPLPSLVLPGQTTTAAVIVSVPRSAGCYEVRIRAEQAGGQEQPIRPTNRPHRPLRLVVLDEARKSDRGICSPGLGEVQKARAEAAKRHRLPDGYTDVTTGRFAALKRWLKQKLLNNFKRAYVDVLSRQQSAFNRHTLTVLQELAECCTLLDQHRSDREPPADLVRALRSELAESQRRAAALEERLARLEEALSRGDRTAKDTPNEVIRR